MCSSRQLRSRERETDTSRDFLGAKQRYFVIHHRLFCVRSVVEKALLASFPDRSGADEGEAVEAVVAAAHHHAACPRRGSHV